MNSMVQEGADIIELGIPFSDPMAEGVSIQKGHERALENGASLESSFKLLENINSIFYKFNTIYWQTK